MPASEGPLPSSFCHRHRVRAGQGTVRPGAVRLSCLCKRTLLTSGNRRSKKGPSATSASRTIRQAGTMVVGEHAMTAVSDGISDSREALYSASRYNTTACWILVMAALGRCSMLSGRVPASDKDIFIETGLPSNQMDRDQKDRRKAIIKAFRETWISRSHSAASDPTAVSLITIYPENIDVVRLTRHALSSVCQRPRTSYQQNLHPSHGVER